MINTITISNKKHPISVRCLFAWLVLMPFSFVPIGNLGSILKLLTVGIIAYYFMKGGRLKYRNSAMLYTWFIYVIYYSISLIWSLNLSEAIVYVIGYIQFFVLAFLFSSESIDNEDIRHLEDAWIFIAIFCIIIFISGGGKAIEYSDRSTLYMLGAFTDPNEFGGYFCIPVALMCSRLFSENRRKGFMYLILIIVSTYIVLRTGSRGALLALIISIIAALLQAARMSLKNTVLIIVITLLSYYIILNYILPQISESVLNRLSFESLKADGGSERKLIWAKAIKYFYEDSLFRQLFGLGVFGGTFYNSTMHNQLLQNLIDGGFIGLILYCVLISLGFFNIYKNYRSFVPGYMGMIALSITLTLTSSYKPFWTLMIFGLIYRRKQGESIFQEDKMYKSRMD